MLKLLPKLVLVCVCLVVTITGTRVKRRAQEDQEYILVQDYARAAASPVIISGFQGVAHKVSSGTVTIKDARTISIQGFSYDGAGPDAYFLVGKGEPAANGRKIPDEKGTYEVLEGYENQSIELILPADLTWNDVDYLSVFCISFNHNFGHVKIPKGLNLPEYGR